MWIGSASICQGSTHGAFRRILAGMDSQPPTPHAHGPSAVSRVAGLALGLLLTLLATSAGLLIAPKWGSAAVVLLYLPPVLVTARYAGLWPALALAVVATLAFNFFFTQFNFCFCLFAR